MSGNHGLPKGWVATSLSTVGKLYCGQSPSVSEVNHSGEGTPYVTGPEMWDGSTLKVDKWTTNPKRKVPNGCIFITVKGAGVGKLFAGVACAIGRDVYAYEPAQELSRKFVEYSLRYNISQILRHAKGDIPGLSKDHILGHLTSFPPLNEQHRIVAKIEELFSDLDAGVAALKRAKANLKRYRASVLKAAVKGKLTEEWRAKHPAKEPASALLARILKERRQKWEADQLAKFAAAEKEPPKNWKEKYVEPTPTDTAELPSIPNSWTWTTLDAIADIVGGITKDQKKANQPGMREVPYLRVANVQRGFLDLSEMKSISASEDDIADLRLHPGDVLFTEGGDRDKLGRGWVWTGELSECIHQNHIFRGRLVSNEMQPRFVSHHGNTFGKEWFIKAGKQTTNLASINLGILRRFLVPIPPAAEQTEIIAQVDEKLSQIDAAEMQIEHGLLRASRLRQSILKQAFEGKLVPQDPKDEPAILLLERLRASRAHDEANGTAATSKRTRAKIKESSGEPRTRNRRGPSSQNQQEE